MTTEYKLPEPAYQRLSDIQSGIDNWYSAAQVMQAYQAGRYGMREEAVRLCMNEAEGYTLAKRIGELK